MKLIIQIPCLNEERTLGATVAALPEHIEGIDEIEILVVDDGSRDRTSEVARELGVHHVIRHRRNRGLAAAFRSGIDHALLLGADVIVNTDADNQYQGADVAKLVAPILAGEADVVVGDRRTAEIAHFSSAKKLLQRFGSAVVRTLSRTDIPDAVSGFRALSREAAEQINIVSKFSYTIEMLIQAGNKRLSVAAVPVSVNPQTRRSRLFRSIPQFLALSAATLVRTYTLYAALRIFTWIGGLLLLAGSLPVARFLYFYFTGGGAGHVQSLVLGGVLVIIGFFTLLIGIIADLISANRILIERILQNQRKQTRNEDYEADLEVTRRAI